jgi:hypothetical protein
MADKHAGALARGRHTDQETHIHALMQSGITRGVEGYDRVAARHGIEPRHPWTDKRLVEFYPRLPYEAEGTATAGRNICSVALLRRCSIRR